MMNKKLIIVAGKLIYRAYKSDRQNRYDLKADWTFVYKRGCPSAYHGKYITLEPHARKRETRVTILAPGDCDGATFAPDWVPGAIEAAIFHDPFYVEFDLINKEWCAGEEKWTEDKTQSWGDGCFAAVMGYFGGGWLRRLYYRGVRLGGKWFRKLGRLKDRICLAVATALLVAGCAVPGADDVIIEEPPQYIHYHAGEPVFSDKAKK